MRGAVSHCVNVGEQALTTGRDAEWLAVSSFPVGLWYVTYLPLGAASEAVFMCEVL